MAIRKDRGRQWVLWAYQEVSYDDLVEATEVEIIDLPPRSVIVDGFVEVSEANNQGTSAVADIGITGTPTQFTTDTNLATVAAAKFAVANLGVPTGNGTAVTVRATLVGAAATAGKFRVGVAYVTQNRSNENQPY